MLTATVNLPTLHDDQVKLLNLRHDWREGTDLRWVRNAGGMLRAVRCGRRYGKTTFLETWLGDGALKGMPSGYFAPTYKYVSETYERMHEMLEPVLKRRGGHNKTDGILRLRTGGSVEFWTLEDPRAGRSRKYRRVALDEAAFTKPKITLETWRQSIKPTLGDLRGAAIAASNTNGVDPENFLYAICNDPTHGFIEYHAPAWANPHVPIRLPGQSYEAWLADQRAYYDNLRAREHPLVFAQEYAAEFVDWSGVAFFERDKLLVDGHGLELPTTCEYVYAVVDSATKTGTDNDGTAVTWFVKDRFAAYPLIIADWDLRQIEGSLLEAWLPSVIQNGQALAARCGARAGFVGVWIEDANSGSILIQQGQRKFGELVQPISNDLLAQGKDERALSVSGYVYRGEVRFCQEAYDKTIMFKDTMRNHLWSQVIGFKLGDKDAARRADDALDTFTYGIAIGLGDSEGF